MPENSSSERSTRLDHTQGPLSGAKPQLPNHELLRCIGSGGFGEVWLARNIMGTYRAAKVIYRRNFSDQRPYDREFHGLQRFEPISRSHDGFVDILDTGQDTVQGYFYYVMEVADDVVSGNKIDPESYKPKTLDKEAAKSGCVPVQTCVSLGVSLSAALAYLHQHGLLHRDIKPSNIIFVNGIPKIADIGLVAKVEGTQTSPGFTTGYFSPKDGPGTVQADIYALGKVLYELSTGQDRCEFPDLPADLDSKQDPDQFRELNQVILKACEDDPHKRYRKAEEMNADLLLLLAGKSVRRIRVLEARIAQFKKAGIAAALILLVAAGTLFGWNRHLRRLAEQKQQQVGRNVVHGNNLVDEGDFFGALPFFWEALRLEQDVTPGEKNNRLRIGALLEQCPRIAKLWILPHQYVNAADLSQDGQYVITAGKDGTAMLCDVTTSSKSLWSKETDELEAVSFSPDRRYVAAAGKGFVKVWEFATHTLVSTASPPATVYGVKFTPDGSQFVTASGWINDGHVCIYETKNPGRGVALTNGFAAYRCVAFNTNGTRLVTTCENGIAQVWDFTKRKPIGTQISHNQGTKTNWIHWAAFSPDGGRVVTVSQDGTVQMCETETGKRIFLLRYPQAKSVAFSPDGRYIVTACWDHTARIADASTGELIYPTLKQSGNFLMYVSFSPDGHQVLTANANGIICLWDLATSMRRSSAEGYLLASEDGHRLCAIQSTNIYVFDPHNLARGPNMVAHSVQEVKLSKEGNRLMTLSEKLQSTNRTTFARLWDTENGHAISPAFATDSYPTNAFLSDDGTRLVTWKQNRATVWDALTGQSLHLLDHADSVKGACFSPNGARMATIGGTNANDLYLWNALNGANAWIRKHIDAVEHVAFSPDSSLLVACVGSPGTLLEREAWIYEVNNGNPVGLLPHSDGVKYAEFSRDSKRVLTASEDATARVWDVLSGKLVFLLQHRSPVAEAHFSSDGRWIVTACEKDGTARVWDAETGEPLTPPLHHPWQIREAQFVDGDHKILTRGWREKGWTPMLWELPIEQRSLEELAKLAKVLSGHQLELKGAVLPQKPEDIQEAWEYLRARKDFTVSQQEIINWHQREAEASEKENQWGAAVFHWQRLVDTKPDDQNYQDHLQRAREQLKRTNELKP